MTHTHTHTQHAVSIAPGAHSTHNTDPHTHTSAGSPGTWRRRLRRTTHSGACLAPCTAPWLVSSGTARCTATASTRRCVCVCVRACMSTCDDIRARSTDPGTPPPPPPRTHTHTHTTHDTRHPHNTQDLGGIQTTWGTVTAVGLNPYQGPAVQSRGLLRLLQQQPPPQQQQQQQQQSGSLPAEGTKPVRARVCQCSAVRLRRVRAAHVRCPTSACTWWVVRAWQPERVTHACKRVAAVPGACSAACVLYCALVRDAAQRASH
jgi:hypothetical protein